MSFLKSTTKFKLTFEFDKFAQLERLMQDMEFKCAFDEVGGGDNDCPMIHGMFESYPFLIEFNGGQE